MRKSLLVRYTVVSVTIIIISLLFIGSMTMSLVVGFFRNSEYRFLDSNLQSIIDVTKRAIQFQEVNYQNTYDNVLCTIYENYFNDDFQLIVCDKDGNIYHEQFFDDAVNHDENTSVPKEFIEEIDNYGILKQTDNLGGFFCHNYYIVGRCLEMDSQDSDIYVFLANSPTELKSLLGNIFNKFILTTILSMCLSFIILFAVTFYLVKPLKQMAFNAKEYEKGNFTPKLDVNTQDEIGELASAINSMSSSLARMEESRRGFVANVSHELKTPMTTISGFIDGMKDGTISKNDYDHYFSVISNEVKRLSRLVQSMLNLSRIESGNLELKIVPINAVDVIGRVLISFSNKIEDKKLDIRGLDVADCWIKGDEGLIHQVFYNLIENAIKFVNDGGYIEFSFVQNGSNTKISIKNSGNGLSNDEVEKLFDRFYKTEESRYKDKTGVGLGLNIVKTIVNLHDGKIDVSSIYGEYTEFTITLKTSKIRLRSKKRKIQ